MKSSDQALFSSSRLTFSPPFPHLPQHSQLTLNRNLKHVSHSIHSQHEHAHSPAPQHIFSIPPPPPPQTPPPPPKDERQRRDIINDLTAIHLDHIVASLWAQSLSRKVCEQARLDLDYFRPILDADDRQWLLGSFSGLNEAVGQLGARDDEELQGGRWTRGNVLEMLLGDYVEQDKNDRVECRF